MNAPKNKPVIVHASLRAVGQTEGMAQGFLDALIEYFTSDGGLIIVPTHTWSNYDKKISPTLDFTSNETCTGTLSNVACADKRGIRTDNPTHSVVVFGQKQQVQDFVSGEENLLTPTAPNGVYGKIFEMGGYVLLVGVGQEKNTCLHCVDEMLKLPNRLSKLPVDMTVKYFDGRVKKRKFHAMISDVIYDVSLFFPKYQPAFDAYGAITHGVIGNANAQLCDAKKMKDVMYTIYKNSGGIEIMADDTPLKKEWYLN